MLKEEKIRLMTKLARYESGEGKEAIGEDSSDDETAKTLTKKEEPKEEE